MRLVNNIIAWLNRLSQQQGVPISELQLDFDEVLSGTGPSAFTTAILAEMSVSEGKDISWDPFHDLEESRAMGGVLVLPSEAFAAGTGHSDSGNHGGRAALVMHHFHASSWPTQHPRYKHPVSEDIQVSSKATLTMSRCTAKLRSATGTQSVLLFGTRTRLSSSHYRRRIS